MLGYNYKMYNASAPFICSSPYALMPTPSLTAHKVLIMCFTKQMLYGRVLGVFIFRVYFLNVSIFRVYFSKRVYFLFLVVSIFVFFSCLFFFVSILRVYFRPK